MTENNKNDQQAQQIDKAYTFFMVPFYYDTDVDFSKVEMWKLTTEKVSNEGEDGDVLYSHIMDFLQGQMNDSVDQEEHLDIYSLNIEKESLWYTEFWSPFINHANVAYIPIGKNDAGKDEFRTLSFNILSSDEQGFKAPHLFIYRAAKIGILTFCVEFAGKKKNISGLKQLNYHLHKIFKPTCRCVCPNLSINEKRRFVSDEEKISVEVKLQKVRQYITPYDEMEDYSPYKDFTWDMKGFIDLLLTHIDCHLFSNIRMHVFTYCQIDDSDKELLTKEDLLPDLLRLSRCVSDKYMLPFEELVRSGATLQSFENIYYASSVEGTAIIAVAKKVNKGFISQLDGNVRLRYLWIYMLTVVQRYTLLNMNRQLIQVASENNESKLWNLIKAIKEVKIRCYYTDVSPYTQHSQFYQLCCKNLHIKEAFQEIDTKTKALNLTISHDLQKLLEEQQATMQQQHQEEEKREKEQEKMLRRAEHRAQSGQNRLNLVVGILTVFQVAGVIYAFFSDTGCWQLIATFITFVIGFFLLYIVMSWDNDKRLLIKWARNIYYRGKVDQ